MYVHVFITELLLMYLSYNFYREIPIKQPINTIFRFYN